MEIAYYAVVFGILLLTIPLGSQKTVYSAAIDPQDYSPLHGLSTAGRKATVVGALLIAAVLIVLCVLKPETLPDVTMYRDYYEMGGATKINRDVEPSFGWITRMSPSFLILLGIYATLSVGFHVLGIFKNSPNLWLSLFIYVLYTFVLHDMIQMRAGVAIGMMLFAVRFIVERKWYWYFTLVVVASFFHYTAMIFVFFYFLPSNYLNKWIWSGLLLLVTVAGLMNAQFGYLAKFIPLEIVQNYLESYMGNKTYEAAMVGPVRILKVIIAIVMLFNQKSIKRIYPLCIPVLIFYMTSQMSYLLFSDIPVLQGRFGEMFAAFDIFALAMFPLISSRYYYVLCIVPIALTLYQHADIYIYFIN